MTDADLELVVARTRHERFRVLVVERPEYRETVRRMAASFRGEPDPDPPAPAPASFDQTTITRSAPAPRFVPPARYAGPLPDCRHAEPGLETACNPIRCRANHGTTCGGSHATLEHCRVCPHAEA